MTARNRPIPVLVLIGLLAAACGSEPRALHPAARRAAAPAATAVIGLGQRLEPITPGNAARLEQLGSFEQNDVCAVAFDPASDRLAASTHDGIALRQTGDGQLLATLPSGGAWTRSLAFSADGARLAATTLGAVRVWDMASGELLTFLQDFEHEVGGVALSPDGSLVAAGTGSAFNIPGTASVKVWDAATGALRFDYPLPTFVLDVAFSPDGAWLAATAGEQVVVLDAATGAQRAEFTAPGEFGISLAFSPDGARLATGGLAARLWDAASGERLYEFGGAGDANVIDLAFTADGQLLAAAGPTLALWDVSAGAPRLIREIELGGEMNYVNSLALNASHTLLAACEHDEQLRWWGVPASDD